ncbi:MAG TPA: hypothetical protein VHU84_05990 [Lacipirellulaceae bacterium]|nr:hypothetical protein [Lacipirellulaceae bacterium]
MNPETDCPGANCLDESHTNGTWGWTFYVNAPVVVTDIGWYDRGQDGLTIAHRVGLWKDQSGQTNSPYISGSGQQLFEASPGVPGIEIPAGTVAALDGPWRKVSLPNGPITLQPGGYAIGGLDNTSSLDPIRYMLDDLGSPGATRHLAADGRILIGAPGDSASAGFQRPDRFFLVDGVEFGPTLFVIPVPEPATITLMMFCFLLTLRRRIRPLTPTQL